jgi:hypothetical protein
MEFSHGIRVVDKLMISVMDILIVEHFIMLNNFWVMWNLMVMVGMMTKYSVTVQQLVH